MPLKLRGKPPLLRDQYGTDIMDLKDLDVVGAQATPGAADAGAPSWRLVGIPQVDGQRWDDLMEWGGAGDACTELLFITYPCPPALPPALMPLASRRFLPKMYPDARGGLVSHPRSPRRVT